MNRSILWLGVSILFGVSQAVADNHVDWSYEGETGPAHWGALSEDFVACQNGQLQAPIDIQSTMVGKAANKLKTFYRPSAGDIVNNGHTIQVNLKDGGYAQLAGSRYNILQFHLHTPSEETVNGVRYPMNAHLVHVKQPSSSYDAAPPKLAVIGLFFKEGQENAVLKPVLDAMPTKPGSVSLVSQVDLTDLLPASLAFYSYAGSLTTPACTEGVDFYILKVPVELSPAQLQQFKQIFPMNARPIQRLNGRQVVEGN
jgi:carbonic anhydrase